MATRLTKTEVPLEDMLNNDEDVEHLTIMIKDKPTLWEYRKMSWQEKQKCVSKATLIIPDSNGGMTFGFDIAAYYTEALKTMIVAAPFPITPTTLAKMDNSIGDQLVAIIPVPLGNIDAGEATKKDSGISFEEIE